MGKKILVIPDSFKGSMSSEEVTDIIASTAQKAGFEAILVPIADGGEGSIDCILRILGGKKVSLKVVGPEGKKITAHYGITPSGKAVIEIAESTGITRQSSLHPMSANTYGFGELIKDALDKGSKDFLLCLGGSASTDMGLGMAAALGARFFDKKGKSFVPTGESMKDIEKIDLSKMDARVLDSNFLIMSDVENPLYGEKGAAYVFSPQKGATAEEVKILDNNLRHAAKLVREATGCDFESVKGAGAAGGSGYGCVAFLKAKISSGIDAMLDLCGFEEKISDCELIVTGEGKLDEQSLMGKVLSGIKRRAKEKRIVSFCGISTLPKELERKSNITVIEIGKNVSIEESIKNGKKLLKKASEEFFNELKERG